MLQVRGTILLPCTFIIQGYYVNGRQILTGKVPYCHLPQDHQVLGAVLTGKTPTRPSCDIVTEHRWAFIQRCWSTVDAAKSRPSNEEILNFTKGEMAESNPR